MSIQVKFRRGTSTQHNSFTGANGEITVDTTNNTLRVHDGVTVGGIRIAKFSEVGTATQYLQVANAAALYTTKAYAAANSYVKSTLANTNSFIATKLNTTTFNSALANTNSYIASRASWSSLTSTNTALRVLISDRLQVANAVATYQTKTIERAALANTNLRVNLINTNLTGTNTAIRTLVSDRIQVANVNTLLANKASWTALAGTNTAIRTLISDRMQVANTNTLVNGRATWSALSGTNTALRTLVSDRLQVANAATIYQTKTIERAALANTNSFIKGQLANTNSYIAAQASRITLVNTNLLATNTAIRSLISSQVSSVIGASPDALNTLQELANALGNNANFATATTNLIATKISVANTKAYLANTNAFIKTQLANTNISIATRASWTALAGTNTSLRTLISDRLQVANAATIYQTKTIERAALANTNLRVNLINTNLTGTNTALRTLISDRLQVANAAATYLTKNNPVVTGTLTANGSVGTSGYYLRTSGAGIYWSPVATSTITTVNATSQIFSGTGSQTNFSLSAAVSQQKNVIITVNGLLQIPVTHYTISGSTLSFTSAPYSGAAIEARNLEGVVISGGSGGTISSGDLFIGSMLLGGM